MNRAELDQLVAEHGAEAETDAAQDEVCKVMSYKQELDYLFKLMGVTE